MSMSSPGRQRLSPRQQWSYAKKFLDYLEANAGEYWRVPHLEIFAEGSAAGEDEDEGEELPQDGEDLYGAAYEQLTYRDSTNDGIDGSLFETARTPRKGSWFSRPSGSVARLAFLATVAHCGR